MTVDVVDEPPPRPLDETLPQDESQAARSRELSATTELPPGEVPGFQIIKCLGTGAFGSVWLAREANTGKHVAVKFYSHRRGLDWSLLNREVEKLAVLYTSRNIVSLLQVGWNSDPPFYVMEYLENGSLGDKLARGPASVVETVRVARSILKALVHAHGAGILHCDLKPANVLLGADGEARLCDFGQSRLSHEQNPALGTLFYMAPEQADLKAIPDARWDVFAFGALLHHMLTGQAPYRTPENEALIQSAETLEEKLSVYRRVVRHSVRPVALKKTPGVDRRLADIVEKCLRTDPSKRFSNAQAVLNSLDARDRQRARRPWIAVGLLGPTLLLIAMIYIVSQIGTDAVESARHEVTQRALESDMLSARILANSLAEELSDRTRELEVVADLAGLRGLIVEFSGRPYAERGKLLTALDDLKREYDKRISSGDDTSWFLCDSHGKQVWRAPESKDTIDRIWAHRDYFHGHNNEYDDDNLPADLQPIHSPHVSLAFRSHATNKFMFAISVPVWDATGMHVIGVLARTTHLDELRQQFGRRLRGQNDNVSRVIAIVDHRDWILRDHTGLTSEMLSADSASTLERLKLDEKVVERMQSRMNRNGSDVLEVQDDDYLDPLARLDPEHYAGRWLAAVSAIQGTGWAVIVQERRDLAMEPVDEMQRGLTKFGLWAISISFGLIVVLWAIVMRAMNRR
ncbi:MAG: serine/threonine protein kinase [Planctomycetota bacterium]|nr:serine/threonine protein kinase [Planctomycetota bacterium]